MREFGTIPPCLRIGLAFAKDTLRDCLAARMADPQTPHHHNERTCPVWRKPMEEFFKCNVDAGFGSDKRSFGIGMVIRDSNGSFIVSRTNFHDGAALVKEAEALAIHEALSWIKELGYDKVIVETDSKISEDEVHSEEPYFTEFGLTISACRALIRNQSSLKFGNVRRQANRAAHTLVKTALQQACFGTTYVTPISIHSIIMDDCNYPPED
ncbi:uncharacterized protein [Primulina huaijiensis]|uniref:uncharacterized protein n=1 Tax=Primulina huaijiensis TaxID=1492673 RepID=UPI003CC7836E